MIHSFLYLQLYGLPSLILGMLILQFTICHFFPSTTPILPYSTHSTHANLQCGIECMLSFSSHNKQLFVENKIFYLSTYCRSRMLKITVLTFAACCFMWLGTSWCLCWFTFPQMICCQSIFLPIFASKQQS